MEHRDASIAPAPGPAGPEALAAVIVTADPRPAAPAASGSPGTRPAIGPTATRAAAPGAWAIPRLARAAASVAVVASLVAAPAVAAAQDASTARAPSDVAITGFSPEAAARQRSLERRVLESIRPALLDSISYALTREPHVAGSAAQARTRDRVIERTRAWGLESEVKAYRVYLPWPTAVELEMTAPDKRRFELGEAVEESDPVSALPQYPWVLGYSGTGAVEGDVVYVNYGLHDDYALLDSIGVSVEGKIVIARFGRSYRGIKSRLAERHGAVGILIYTDPMDDGWFRGDVYPEGPWRHWTSAQRGSVMNGAGDPTTPGWASVEGARRVEPGSAAGFDLPGIPAITVSAAVAEPILRALRGAELPDQAWQGALPFRYHVGPGATRVRLKVADDRETNGYKEIWNTVAWVRGAERPDEWVIVGGHRDAWNAGASDNVSGTASVLAAARAVAELARAGMPPRRTIAFATWDAEEWGLIGSVEWVEELAGELGAKAVAYLNQDGVAGGPEFGASAAPSLKALVRDVARAVPDPAGGTVYEHWRAREAPPDTAEVPLGNLGGGSDFAPFYNHLGIPSAGWGFGGNGTQYHGAFDTYAWLSKYADPGFRYHEATAELTVVAALRLANAQVLPYDYGEFARELRGVVARLAIEAGERRLGDAGLAALDAALARMAEAADAFAIARDAALADRTKAAAPRGETAFDAANRHLMRVERSLTRPEGLVGRPWYRNLIFAADARNGYATIALPSIAEAIRAGDRDLVRREAGDLAQRVDAATAHIVAATAALRD
ncbi:MAG TPA: M20/M25/M40 family metallo-hydrolase [Longimicrobiales bacterium]